jgi:ribosomal protein S18 acetylase RimI-like enzyme
VTAPLTLTAALGPAIVPAFLALELESAEGYNNFVYGTSGRAAAAQRILFETSTGEGMPPHARAVLRGEEFVGILSVLPNEQLKRARLAAAVALARAGVLEDPSLKARLRLAARAQHQLEPTDYYCARIGVEPKYRGHREAGATIGETLLAIVREEARRAGAARVVLSADAERSGLITFYESCGYRVIGGSDVTDHESHRQLHHLHLATATSGEPRQA